MAVYISESPEETMKAGEEYAKTLSRGDVVLLNGEMGAGKTVFTKGIARGLKISDEITSPTYAYMNDYSGRLYHFDCYRLSCGEQAEGLGLCDYFYADGICVLEWAENIKDALPEKTKTVNIKVLSGGRREIEYE